MAASPPVPAPALPAGTATGVGGWPGTDLAEALRVVRGELADLPHLPELPDRGPGADLVGRAAARLVGLSVDLQPAGWRLVDRPGRDQARADAFWREDLDRMAYAFDGYEGPLKVQLAGPWTLAASLWLHRGERALADPGAARDLVESSAEALTALVREVSRLVPGASVVAQIDEPSLTAVLEGRVPTASGLGRLRAIEPAVVEQGLTAVLAAATAGGATPVVHSCAPRTPIGLLARTGATALSLHTSLLGASEWESVAAAVEDGVALWAGVVPTSVPAAQPLPSAADLSAGLVRSWLDVGLPPARLADVVLTPACGLSGRSPDEARALLARTVETGRAVAERSAD
jgi:methionine synthase II (cobalamin-independent)